MFREATQRFALPACTAANRLEKDPSTVYVTSLVQLTFSPFIDPAGMLGFLLLTSPESVIFLDGKEEHPSESPDEILETVCDDLENRPTERWLREIFDTSI